VILTKGNDGNRPPSTPGKADHQGRGKCEKTTRTKKKMEGITYVEDRATSQEEKTDKFLKQNQRRGPFGKRRLENRIHRGWTITKTERLVLRS